MFSLRKAILLILLVFIGYVVYYIAIPQVKKLQQETLGKRVQIEISSGDKKGLPVTFGTSTIVVDLAVTQDEKRNGLSGRYFLDDDKGLLFVYEKPSYPAIWMKEMLFPIDIVWLDRSFNVVHVRENASPTTYPQPFRPDLPAMYVLELNAGYLKAHGVSIGDKLILVDTERISL